MTKIDLQGKGASVTGGGHGIGRALVEALADRGARVAVGDPAAVAALVATTEAELGPVELAASNAGITDPGLDLASTVAQVRHITDVNLLAHVWMAQAVLPGVVERGSDNVVQTISSAALITGSSGMATRSPRTAPSPRRRRVDHRNQCHYPPRASDVVFRRRHHDAGAQPACISARELSSARPRVRRCIADEEVALNGQA